MNSWREDPNVVIAVDLIDQAHDYERLARQAPTGEVEALRDAAAKCRAMVGDLRRASAALAQERT